MLTSSLVTSFDGVVSQTERRAGANALKWKRNWHIQIMDKGEE